MSTLGGGPGKGGEEESKSRDGGLGDQAVKGRLVMGCLFFFLGGVAVLLKVLVFADVLVISSQLPPSMPTGNCVSKMLVDGPQAPALLTGKASWTWRRRLFNLVRVSQLPSGFTMLLGSRQKESLFYFHILKAFFIFSSH
jgi:hypothetical protein